MILTHFLGLPRGLRSLGGSTCIQKQMKERESVMYLNKHHSAQVLCVKFSYFGCDPLAFIFTASWPSSRPPGSRSFNRLLRDSVHLVLLNLFHLSSISLHLSDLLWFAGSSSPAFGSWCRLLWGRGLHLTCSGLLHVHPDPRPSQACMDTHNLTNINVQKKELYINVKANTMP